MIRDYRIEQSLKPGFLAEENWMVVRGGEVFLRLVGGGGLYSLMTATTGEARSSLRACTDQDTLRAAARQTAACFHVEPHDDQDSSGRDFVRICSLTVDGSTEQARQQTLKEIYEVCDTFFENLTREYNDERIPDSSLKEIYDVLAVDDTGGPVYLNDGMWLGSDGSLSDLGR